MSKKQDKKPLRFIRREIEPIEIKIAGEKYPAILSYRALALCEEVTNTSHLITLARFLVDNASAMDVIGLLYGVLSAADTELEVDVEDLKDSLPVSEWALISSELKRLINQQGVSLDKDDESNSKNAEAPATERQIGTA
jgi:hypothetical protein